MLRLLTFLGLLDALAAASPIVHNGLPYHSHEARQANLPTIKLPYGTWQASKYDAANDIYTFANIRFAAPPVGQLRFAKPAPPAVSTTVQTGSVGGTCPQSVPASLIGGLMGSALGGGSSGGGLGSLLGSLSGSLLQSMDLGKLMGGAASSEDCLFLDVYVPGKALKGQVKLPVVNWIYGGAYILGAKDGMYAGGPVVKASGGNVIYVAGNYRLGAFGFLAGSTMEKEGLPNAGFWDQRAVLQWIQDHIHLVGGDPTDVSVWGESAGAGSILHHITAFGGKQDPLFKKAVIQSPAFNPQYDRKGDLERQFQKFAEMAGCAGKGVACLRAADFKTIKTAQDAYIKAAPPGTFGFGPSTDGNFVRQLPALELASGNFAKSVQTVVLSHVIDEASMFVQDHIKNDTAFNSFIEYGYGNNSDLKAAITKAFPSPSSPQSKYKTQRARVSDYIEFSTFTCNVRYMTEAFKGRTYNIQYARGQGTHGSDIRADFYGGSGGVLSGGSGSDKSFPQFAAQFQSYLTSHARTGDVNKLRINGTIEWPIVTIGPALSNVLNATDNGFELISDTKTKAEDCDFWRDIFASVTNALGYAPPGAVLQSNTLKAAANPSANF
ncbi:alpha/beta-hydrolase [Trichodelitschia bisporula]|uniref:Alpha/beta-hydrolase n=1 Tax=Trichodelitschia bisporula TaxID=703511 RepID=A0A6G1HVD8_9PEZI|nr:alpha/beta-hydrolase [Trichodelitschia bisporula]